MWVNFTPYGVGEPEKKQTEAQPAEKESEDIARPKPKPDGEEEEEVVKAKMFVKSTGVTTILSEEDIFLTDKDELKAKYALTLLHNFLFLSVALYECR